MTSNEMHTPVDPAIFDKIQANVERNSAEAPGLVTINGLDYFQDPSVFAPGSFLPTTILFSKYLPYRPNERFLEMGCGVGVVSVTAAVHYDNQVVAIDINSKAVELTSKNAQRHNVGDRVDSREGDLFSPLREGEKFDTMFWNWPLTYVPDDYQCQSLLEMAVCDPGYRLIGRFLSEAREYLTPEGRIILTFGSMGNYEIFEKLIHQSGYSMTKVHEQYVESPLWATYFLYELKIDS